MRHVSAPAVRSKRSGAPPPRSVRWETSPGPPAAMVPFARQRAAAIQFGLPVDRTGLCDRCKRQERHCSECFLHVSSGITLGRAHDLNLCAHVA